MELKPLALIVLLKAVASPNEHRSYQTLGQSLGISGSQAHAAVRQALRAGLATERERGQWQPVRPALLEFIVHGVQYVWPATFGPNKRGIPTAFGAEPLSSLLSVPADEAPVWAHPGGTAKGPTLSPLHACVPQAALADPALHQLLALADAVRAGRARERTLAAKYLQSCIYEGKPEIDRTIQ